MFDVVNQKIEKKRLDNILNRKIVKLWELNILIVNVNGFNLLVKKMQVSCVDYKILFIQFCCKKFIVFKIVSKDAYSLRL